MCRQVAEAHLTIVFVSLLVASGCGPRIEVEKAEQFPFEKAAGEVLGSKITAAVPGGGMLLVLTRSDATGSEGFRQEALLAGLTATTGNFLPVFTGPNLSAAGAKKQEIEERVAAQGWPSRSYLNWCKSQPDVVAIASLIDLPSDIKAGDLARLSPIFVCSRTGVDKLRELVSKGAVQTAIVPREGASEKNAPRKGTAAEVVALRYETLTR